MEMPGFLSVYREIHNSDPSGIEWDAINLLSELFGPNFVWGPPGMDQRAIEPLRKAFYAAASSPDFIAKQDKVFGFRYEPIAIDDAQRIVARMSQVDPKLIAFFKNFMK
jgi:hypothetical protein